MRAIMIETVARGNRISPSSSPVVGMAIFLTQYLQLVRGMIPLTAALWSVLPSVAVGGVAPPASRWVGGSAGRW
ncbi:hypothetical protein ACIG0C_15190 [Kitasatospora aureofaciens]|uniref:Uncharacterized protein n=1 Tax=Kitasatospora aureofaciens TaxID=1894 RepID=A0A8H9LQE3_KITAU|nr:hypothetical protein [Kitasatospora aureofaciens]GGU95411.1 hypothetical protein GCM10010502_56550 [Kitasatospora aureofaciens]